jgi:hypothetical protein
MNYYCTLFDSNYFLRGYTMVKSLLEKDPNSFIYIFPFDEEAYNSLEKLNIRNVKLVSLKEFENKKLLSVKEERTRAEYCWTCTPWIIKYCIEFFKLEQCIYVDADLFFFDNPQLLLDEAKNSSILITEHRYSKKYDQTKNNGKYCVQFLEFKDTDNGRLALNWWADKCIEWCFARIEDGKFGDQKYLDDWESRFKEVHSLKYLGGGVAPWNLDSYRLINIINDKIELIEEKTNTTFNLIFYHFHEVKLKNMNINLFIDFYHYPPENFDIHITYYNHLKSNFKYLFDLKIKSEKFYELSKDLLDFFYKLKSENNLISSYYRKKIKKLYYLNLIIGLIIIFLEYFLLKN